MAAAARFCVRRPPPWLEWEARVTEGVKGSNPQQARGCVSDGQGSGGKTLRSGWQSELNTNGG